MVGGKLDAAVSAGIVAREVGEVPAVPGASLIGCGYDPFGDYAAIDNVKAQLFDWSSPDWVRTEFPVGQFRVPQGIDAHWIGDGRYSVVYGASINSVRRQLASRVNLSTSFLFFSSSFSSEFTSDQLASAENEFTRIQETQRVWGLRLSSVGAARSRLKDGMGDALAAAAKDGAAAERLFETYGSHVLASLVMGGRVVYSCVTDRTQLEQSTAVRRSAEVGFQWTQGSAGLGSGGGESSETKAFNAASRTSYVVAGGDLGLHVKALPKSGGDGGVDPGAMGDWVSSVATRPTFVDFYGSDPLIGIWEFCGDPADRTKLEAHFQNWARKKSEAARIHPDFISDIKIIVGTKADITPPRGFKKVPGDLNAGANGNYMYVCYRTTSHAEAVRASGGAKCITELRLAVGKTDKPPSGDGFTYDSNDLNKGSGGSYVFLGYKPGTYAPGAGTDPKNKPILGIKVMPEKAMKDSALDDFEMVPGNLNDGIANAAMYLFVTRGASDDNGN